MWRTVRRAAAILGAATILGCGDRTYDPAEGKKACEDLADRLATSAGICGLDYQANYDATVEAVAGGDCANVKGLTDHDSFYLECLPFLAGLTCEELTSTGVKFPVSCAGQLVR